MISFYSVEGFELGKIQVKYKDVEIGMVKMIKLLKDLLCVLVQVQFKKEVEDFVVQGLCFWIVWLCVGVIGVLGFGMLLFGVYIGVDVGYGQDMLIDFIGLEMLFVVIGDQKGM